MLKNRLLPLFTLVVCVFFLFAGCTININVGNPAQDAAKDTDGKTIFDYIFNNGNQTTVYESRAIIYISYKTINTSYDLSGAFTETFAAILNSEEIQSKIQEEYPNLKYELTLELLDTIQSNIQEEYPNLIEVNVKEMFTIIATSENPEKLEDVCNFAASLFCEEIPHYIPNFFCRVVNYAKSTQEVGTN